MRGYPTDSTYFHNFICLFIFHNNTGNTSVVVLNMFLHNVPINGILRLSEMIRTDLRITDSLMIYFLYMIVQKDYS